MVYLLSFFYFVLYNYYGDNMNKGNVILNVSNIKDIENITDDTKYINISIDNVSIDVIDYFLLNGDKFSYSDSINNRNGFIYASYDMFKYGESVIDNIIANMPSDLNSLEKIRYVYIYLGKIFSSDINVIDNKNEFISFSNISSINNIWGAISKGKIGDAALSKVLMYVCSRIGIKSELISSSIKGSIANKIYFDDSFLIVDLFNDLHNIQGGFCTSYFDKYNDNKELDKKIFYIKDEYKNFYIDKVLGNIDYMKEDVLYEILSSTSSVMNINGIGTMELFKIYRNIFDKYVPNYDIKINNLFVVGKSGNKEHFTLFSYNGVYYSFNYNKGCFVSVDEDILCEYLRDDKIGIYDDEEFGLIEKRVLL